MKTKILFGLIIFFSFMFFTKDIFSEELRLLTYSPSAIGSYAVSYFGRGVPPRGREGFDPGNTTTIMRVGVTESDISLPDDTIYVPGLLEIGGLVKLNSRGIGLVGISYTNSQRIILYSEATNDGELGILGISYSTDQPAIFGMIPLSVSSNMPAIIGYAPLIGVYGEANSTGVKGRGYYKGVWGDVGDTVSAWGVHGSANSANSSGIVGTNRNDGNINLPQTVMNNYVRVGVYGDSDTPGIGIVGRGKAGVLGLVNNGMLPTAWASGDFSAGVVGISNSEHGYAGYFEGNVNIAGNLDVSGRARLAIPNIPVFENDGERNAAIPRDKAQNGDLVFNKKGIAYLNAIGVWKLQIFIKETEKWYNMTVDGEE